jgi:SAM-dependent methyltransferase
VSTVKPGWKRLWRHSYRLGGGWLVREARHGLPGSRVGLQRLLVPLDPWRYYELGRIAEADFGGRCLDVSSPKLLPSLLQHERRGDWTAVDLLASEIESWRVLDPALRLEVADATALPYPDDSFDHCVCVSVVEHIAGDGDARALAEMRRVLKPGGVLHLTTNVAVKGREVFSDDAVYGEASSEVEGRTLFERHYSLGEVESRLLGERWEIARREVARQADESIERRFYARAPWSYSYGGLLRLRCPRNFELGDSPAFLADREHGVIYLALRKPA